jgi:hypothetical protein
VRRLRKNAAPAIDRALEAGAEAVTAAGRRGYDLDAQAIAKVMVRHYGDEAEAVLERAVQFLDEVRRAKR